MINKDKSTMTATQQLKARVDSINIYHETGLMPHDILKQRDTAVIFFNHIKNHMEGMKKKNDINEHHADAIIKIAEKGIQNSQNLKR